MAIRTRNASPSLNAPSFGAGAQVRGFVPTEPTSDDLVTVMLLGRKSTSRDRILQTNAQGVERPQVLLNLVGVVLPLLDADGNTVLDANGEVVMTCYPDSGKTKLPSPGTVGFKKIMNMPTGIFVESIFAEGAARVAQLADEGYMPGLSGDKVRSAIADGTLNTLLANRGDYLRSIDGIFTREELTVSDVMSGEKTLSITFFGEGEADAFSESYDSLQKQFGFQNVAICARISGTLQATELASNVSYQPTEYHFYWSPTTVGTRQQYMLDASYAKSGRSYSAQTVGSTNVRELANRGLDKNYERNVGAIQNGRDIRNARRNEQLIRLSQAGQVGAPVPVTGLDDI